MMTISREAYQILIEQEGERARKAVELGLIEIGGDN